ncbi:MAG TPA: potassium-transporting ATPase subunit KdpC [Acidobacteriaceae bacterium]|nr:potassium-transporting ATPase subunit KdpC [Acidobacteriaceae bacterium]
MRKQIITALLYTVVTTLLLGIGYPLGVTLIAHLVMPKKADGELITKNGVLIGSKLLGQTFNGPTYFHSRPSAAGTGYDAANSSGSNLGPTNATLLARVQQSAADERKANKATADIPVDLVTTSGSGLDPDITVAAAEFQIFAIAHARGLSVQQVNELVHQHIQPRQLGVLGEPRVNVLELNLALDDLAKSAKLP